MISQLWDVHIADVVIIFNSEIGKDIKGRPGIHHLHGVWKLERNMPSVSIPFHIVIDEH